MAMWHCLASFVCFLHGCALGYMGVGDHMHLHAACPFQVDYCILVGRHTPFAHTLGVPCAP